MIFITYKNKVEKCIEFLRYYEKLINKIVQEYDYYKNELDNDEYSDDVLDTMIDSVYNNKEKEIIFIMMNFNDWYYKGEYEELKNNDLKFLLKPKNNCRFVLLCNSWLELFYMFYTPCNVKYETILSTNKKLKLLNKLFSIIKNIIIPI